MVNSKRPYESDMIYDCDSWSFCPICGGAIKHPYTGHVTMEQLDEDMNSCIWMEVQDEYDYTLGFKPICKNLHPYTLDEEDNQYVHYDLIELLNNNKTQTLEDKFNTIYKLLKAQKDIDKEDITIEVNGESITKVIIRDEVERVDLTIHI